MEYYSATEGNEQLIHAATWMNVKMIALSENWTHEESIESLSCVIRFI